MSAVLSPTTAFGGTSMNRSTVSCPVCGSTEWREPLARTRLRRCRGCDTYLNDRSADRKQEERLYDHCESQAVQDTDPTAALQWEWVSSLMPVRSGMKVLDIGCGSGAFLRAARESGAEVHGLELDPMGIRAARASGVPVTEGSLFDVGLPAGQWDVVTFWDVLDHLEWPDRALGMAAEALSPGGAVALRGRNAAFHVPLKAWRSRWPGAHQSLRIPDVSVVHRWGFSPAGWVQLAERAGLQHITLAPGLPTPGDRYQSFQSGAGAMKQAATILGSAVHKLSGGHCYIYPSVLLAGIAPSPQ